MEIMPWATYDLSMNTAVLSPRSIPRAALLLPALLACYLVWGSTYFAIRLALVLSLIHI